MLFKHVEKENTEKNAKNIIIYLSVVILEVPVVIIYVIFIKPGLLLVYHHFNKVFNVLGRLIMFLNQRHEPNSILVITRTTLNL
jgi:hypothetical protein